MSDNNERPTAKPEAPTGNHDPTAELKRRLQESRLPPNLKAQILAELPPAQEQERLYRELQENGGLSSEEFLKSLGLEVEPKP